MTPQARHWPPSRIALRLLAFNLLLVFVPVIGVLYLDVYEDKLLQAQEREMVQQARVLAAAAAGRDQLDAVEITAVLARLEQQSEARLRVYDRSGALIADSIRVAPAAQPIVEQAYGSSASGSPSAIRTRILYRLGAWFARTRRAVSNAARAVVARSRLEERPAPAGTSGAQPELVAALAGRYGAATRPTPGQRSLTLFVALPVRDRGETIGAVVVSQSTRKVLQALYEVRLRIFQVVVASILAAALLTTLAAMTIVRPLRRLRRQALILANRGGPLPPSFPGTDRKDELGDLARALEELTRRLNDQFGRLEGFAGDVSHEFKNPLASIRTAAETIRISDRVEDRDRFLAMMIRDVDRLERLVSAVRDFARIDGQLENDGSRAVSLGRVIRDAVGVAGNLAAGPTIRIGTAVDAMVVSGSAERLSQVFDNLISNAVEFAPAGSTVDVEARLAAGMCVVTVSDRGPGIPEAHVERVFDRFFTYRPVSGRGDHVGLGLAIARRIVEGYRGTLTARNRDGGGAIFEVCLPAARGAWPAPDTRAAAELRT